MRVIEFLINVWDWLGLIAGFLCVIAILVVGLWRLTNVVFEKGGEFGKFFLILYAFARDKEGRKRAAKRVKEKGNQLLQVSPEEWENDLQA